MYGIVINKSSSAKMILEAINQKTIIQTFHDDTSINLVQSKLNPVLQE